MEPKIRRPAWWMLYVLLIGMLGLILLESQDGAPNWVHEIIDGVIVIGFFGSLVAWVHINESELERADLEHAPLGELHIVEYGPIQSAYSPDSPYTPKPPVDSRSRVDDDRILLPFRNN